MLSSLSWEVSLQRKSQTCRIIFFLSAIVVYFFVKTADIKTENNEDCLYSLFSNYSKNLTAAVITQKSCLMDNVGNTISYKRVSRLFTGGSQPECHDTLENPEIF